MSLAKKVINEIGTKRIVKFLLPHDDKYTISDYFVNHKEHSLCDNCKKRIVYSIEVKNSKGKKFKVGVDCAETLSSLDAIKLGNIKKEFKEIINLIKKTQKFMSNDISFLKKKGGDLLSVVYIHYKDLSAPSLLEIWNGVYYFSSDILNHTSYFDKIKIIDNENEFLSFYKDVFNKMNKNDQLYRIMSLDSHYKEGISLKKFIDTPKLDKLEKERKEKEEKEEKDKEKEKKLLLLKNLEKDKFVIIYDDIYIKWHNDNYWYMIKQQYLDDVLGGYHNRISYKEWPVDIITNKKEKLIFHHKNKANIEFIEGKEYKGQIYAMKGKDYLLFVPTKVIN